eukprot:GFYU01003474.1.p1 GENE.GFYU01003474.1~~GFYU01003474.1.p1  ORF type:complete len:506 (+),score=134.29 GFYU01003474.1:134-1651(+)
MSSSIPDFPSHSHEEDDVKEFTLQTSNQKYTADLESDYNDLPTYPDRPHFHDHHLSMKPATQLICFDGCPKDPFRPASMPLYQTATFVQPSAAEFGPYDYTRSGNPTRTALETLIAGLEDAYMSFAFTSGMAALNTVCRLVKSGEEVIASADLYGGMYRLLTKVTQRNGVVTKFVDTSNFEEVKKHITKKTRLIHLETPSNPLMRITDLKKVSDLAHQYGALVSVDSTMMSPYLAKPLNLGVDIVIHSATKFLSGHSDAMAGVVCCKTESVANEIAFYQNAEGVALAPFDCWLLLRSIKTLALRVERAQQNAVRVAKYLSRHPAVELLHYVGTIDDPVGKDAIPWQQNKWGIGSNTQTKDGKTTITKSNITCSESARTLHYKQSRGGGSVLSFQTGNVDFSRRVVNACRLFKITVSFGSCNSLIEMPCTLSHASIPTQERTLPEDLIRLSIGVEDSSDIIQDLDRAFRCAASGVDNVRDIDEGYEDLPRDIDDITSGSRKRQKTL